MVFFTCNNCGESVKKPAVEKHYSGRCRGPANVSCMDCLKDFHGEEYVAHTKCISEAKKYSGKDFVEKEAKNSNAKKQESWIEILRSILDSQEYNLSASARSAFQRLQAFENVPRKKAKFENFISNCQRMPRAQATEIWNVLERELEKLKQERAQAAAAEKAAKDAAKQAKQAEAAAAQSNGVEKQKKRKSAVEDKADEVAAEPAKKKTKKQKNFDNAIVAAAEENDEAQTNSKKKTKINKLQAAAEAPPAPMVTKNGAELQATELEESFEWQAVLTKIVGKKAENGVSLEKLKQKVLKKYKANLAVADALSAEQLKKFEKKFKKNLKKSTNLQMQGDLVMAC